MSWSRLIDSTDSTALWLAALASSYATYKALSTYLAKPSTANSLRGPESPSWLFGNTEDNRLSYDNRRFESWMREYGTVFPVHGAFGGQDLLIVDTAAMSYILNQPSKFPKPTFNKNIALNLVGNGLLVAEGFEHKRQRKVLVS
ncbi:hypothetical protein FRB94_005552 [Tulasnella sp. JGI-2019a]|nr:hypothetical protein FRB94_005552 [Tulasnella sp. JGI-2019a]